MNQQLNTPDLYQVYKNFFTIGAAVNSKTLESEKELLKKHYNSLTAENEMKFELLQPEQGNFNFANADKLVAFANENNMKLRGHTLVWHNQTTEWLFQNPDGTQVNREILLQRMEEHISTVLGRYKGQFYSWDVVNEAISDDDSEYLRKSKWLDIIGEDFIAKAFEFAHQADPNASLFYNDYNESHPNKRERIYRLVKSLLDKDVPIHGVGLQAHWNVHDPSLDDIRAAIERYASLGVQLQITEMDVSMFSWDDRRADLTQPTEEMLHLQAERYDQFFRVFREYKEVISNVTFWGANDSYTWLNDFPVRGRKNWPFVFGENGVPKESFWRIAKF
ncbi:endo-1,4-beta-xylanase [Halalkalibacter akibai]|uniref:Beta-xylanase n=1 Tax=Halalkalibacter akibai (strain ATCC 43226 / DSM 21942 / CIP 109018 / JCM 9157 / 1139) TaxID=1236973 RepID=W4R105_HALA3|nr:endo-1,4-beta-xylanase [Halalkalibacter akibai]GAE37578.1 endo-1,4-beta-xylanase A precursor [Halalkalibacter akibai JCM 9157]